MKVSLSWLKQYVDYHGTPEALAECLTQLGLEVEGVDHQKGEFAGLVVAQVVTRDKHPNADKLSVCRVTDGQGERQIVCGAQNFKAGDKVPLILPGSALPPKAGETQPFVIKVGKIRGVESHGMLCSADELGLDPEAIGHRREDGLLILRSDAGVGQPLAEYLGRASSEVIFDLEITPNRPDLNSVLGIAREVVASQGGQLRIPEPKPPGSLGEPVHTRVEVRLEAPDLCPRYTARVVSDVKVGPSPDWLRRRLESVGLRSVNNVVDVTNFVMLETGQPLHAFDYDRIARGADGRPTLVIRRAGERELFRTLDGKEHTLSTEHLLIADAERGIALAGVMGGQNSEISPDTTQVLIESAYFSPTNIRRTSKALSLRTDASYRFERGADVQACESASRRCLELILEVAGGVAAEGVVDLCPQPSVRVAISLRFAKVNALLGLSLTSEEIVSYLGRLGIQPVEGNVPTAELGLFAVPSYRVDLKREVDLIEEVVRLYGVGRISSTPPRGAQGSHPFDPRYDRLAGVREILVGLGLCEVQGQTLIAASDVKAASAETMVRLANPLSSDMDCLRPSLLPGLLTVLRHNLNRKNGDVQIFELGRTFTRESGSVRERWRISIALIGARLPSFWTGAAREEKCDIFDLKGILEEVLSRLGIRGLVWVPRAEATGLFLESAQVTLGGKLVLGELGQVLPAIARAHDLRDPVFLAELDLESLLTRGGGEKEFKPLPQFPAARRDLSLIVAEAITHEAILNAIRRAKPSNLENVELFDVFRGKNVPERHKSLAYAFTYRAADRTLKDEEVGVAQTRIIEALKTAVGAQVRE